MKWQTWLVVVFVVLGAGMATGQVATGTPAFGSFGGGPFDTVNLGNLNVHFAIPVLHKAGRGMPFTYDLSYDSSVWTPVTSNGVTQWQPANNWGWTSSYEAALGYVSQTSMLISGGCVTEAGTHVNYTYTQWQTYGYGDQFHVFHPVNITTYLISPQALLCGITGSRTGSVTASDGSGYTLSVNLGTVTVTSRTGRVIAAPINRSASPGSYTDANGNQITGNSSGQFFDTLSSTAPVLTVAGSPSTFTYVAPSGSNATYTLNYTQYTVKTAFGITGVTEYGPLSSALISSITLPDSTNYTFTYETTPGSCTPLSGTTSCVTSRIASITLPTGGTITYTYTGGSNGIESDGSAAGLTRTLSPGGEWQYSRSLVTGTPGPKSTWTTTVIDPNSNQTVINFAEDSMSKITQAATYNFYETQRQVYQGSTLLATSARCYNNSYTSCSTANVTSPITQIDVYGQLPNGGTRLSEIQYNGSGLVTDDKEYNYGVTIGAAPGTTNLVLETAASYTSLGAPSSVAVYDWTSGTRTILSSSTYGYDQTTPTATSGTPQHLAGTNSGNLTAVTTSTSSSTSLTQTFTYYDTGNPYVATDVNNAQTTYVYSSTVQGNTTASCGNSFPTTINEPLSLSRSITWNCTGGVAHQVTDENGNNVTANYTDPDFWRLANGLDQLNNQTNLSYIVQSGVESAVDASLTFNGSNSVSDSRTTVDGFGRPILGQRLQSPGGTNYDTAETDYDNMGRPSRSTMPFTAAGGGTSSTAPSVVTTYDSLSRPLTITDADGGQVSYTYINNDVLQKTSGSQTFQKQFEYDGLARLTSVCEITSAAGSGSCGQSNSGTGFLTKYTYDSLGRMLTVTQNAQPGAIGSTQARTYAYDWAGRLTSESNPETSNTGANGTIAYTYDTNSTCGTSSGDLVKRVDAAGNVTCYSYDALHRLSQAGNSSVANTILRKFFYDSKSSYPTGVTVNYGKTQMVEAQTFNTSNLSAFVTDEFFSYSKRGETTDVYEATPHSGGYYHTTASYWATGAPQSLSGIPGVPAINYGANGAGLDGEGRYTQVTAASGTNPATNIAYSTSSTNNLLGGLTGVTFGSADSDSFAYDPNTGRLTTYIFSVNGKTDTGTLNWNPNGTLQKLAIIDNIAGTSDTQTCNYFYDDLARLGGKDANGYSVDCGTRWQQLFTFDAFGNIAKSGTSSFLPTYSAATNQFTISGATVNYDANGNLKTDNLSNTYTWDPNWSNPTSVNATNLTYDALGRMVEQQNGSSYAEILYSPMGKTALMNGQNLTKAFVNLPGGATAIYNSTGLAYYRHSDWLGSSRLTSTQARGLYSSSAYAPFGEQYAITGASDPSFTGQNSDTVSTLYDFTFREHSPSQGRWISPDPSGLAAVDPTDPQTWNRYAYVLNNPLSYVDPLGLWCSFTTIIIGDDGWNSLVCSVDTGGGSGGIGVSPFAPLLDQSGGAANNGRVPNNITCSTVLPNGRTVGSYVSQVSNGINQQAQVAPVSTPYGPAPNPSFPSPISVASQVYSGTNFRAMFGGPGANYAFLGDAGNFAYGAVSANLGVPLTGAEMVAGAYSLYAHPSSDWGWPWGMDPSARVQVPAGYSAQCK